MKGTFTQSGYVLCERVVDLAELERALVRHQVIGKTPARRETDAWVHSGPAVLVAMRPDASGAVMVDIVDRPWPDEVGGPAAGSTLQGGWLLGCFGPNVIEGGFARATAHAGDRDVAAAAGRHRAFIRLRTSYVIGAGSGQMVLPPAFTPIEEMLILTEMALLLERIPGASCWFDPNGEVVQSFAAVADAVHRMRAGGAPAIEAWTQQRRDSIDHPDDRGQRGVIDVIGMDHLGGVDLEAVFVATDHDADDVAALVAELTAAQLRTGPIADGARFERDGHTWRAQIERSSVIAPARPVMRLIPSTSPQF